MKEIAKAFVDQLPSILKSGGGSYFTLLATVTIAATLICYYFIFKAKKEMKTGLIAFGLISTLVVVFGVLGLNKPAVDNPSPSTETSHETQVASASQGSKSDPNKNKQHVKSSVNQTSNGATSPNQNNVNGDNNYNAPPQK